MSPKGPDVIADLRGLGDESYVHPGLQLPDLSSLAPAADAALADLSSRRAGGEVGFLDLPDSVAGAQACLDYAKNLPPEIDTMVVLGIGGSSLGPRALYSALAPPLDPLRARAAGHRRLLFADNIDPITFAALLDVVDLRRTVWNVVTKSGGTAETCAQLLVVAEHLRSRLGADALPRHLVCTTDPARGVLRGLATQWGLPCFDVPPSVGGRFSVLSAVGLLPAAVAGIDVTGLLDGAKDMRDRAMRGGLTKNPALLLATLLHAHHMHHRRPMVVMMSYVDGLYDTADWFRQLWAESLGKEHTRDGRRVNVGPTPIAARGATDQHSQLQLYSEGPDDKVYIFLSVDSRAGDVAIPRAPWANEWPDLAYLTGKSLGTLLDAERMGTMESLRTRARPVAALRLARCDARSLGALMMLLESATALAGPLYGVDPFDQPGVEEAKRLAFAALGRPGFTSAPAPAPGNIGDPYVV